MLFRKMRRDLKANASQFLAIFFMIFLGIFIYSGMSSIGEGMGQSGLQFYSMCNLADAITYGGPFDQKHLEAISKENGIDAVQTRLQINTIWNNDSATTLQMNVISSDSISGMMVTDGSKFDQNADGIWLDEDFAEKNGVSVGDRVPFSVEGITVEKRVLGLIMHPEYLYAVKNDNEAIPDHRLFGYAFMSDAAWPFPTEIPWNQLLIQSNLNKIALNAVIEDALGNAAQMTVLQKDFRSVAMFRNEVKQMQAVASVYPIAFLLIAVLTTLTTMTRLTAGQRVQIGTLKALGFKQGRIVGHYLSYGLITGFSGSFLGVLLGPVLLPPIIFEFQKTMYTMPEWKSAVSPFIYLMAAICGAICCLCAWLACRGQLKGEAAQVLRPKAPKVGRHTALEKSRLWHRMSFDTQWNIRDVMRNKLRSAVTVFGVMGCMLLLICGMGMRDAMSGLSDTMYGDLSTYNTKVSLSSSAKTSEIENIKLEGDIQKIAETGIEITMGAERESVALTIIDDGPYYHFKNTEGNLVDLPHNKVAITRKMAELKNLNEGDTLSFRFFGNDIWYNTQIATIVQMPMGQGVYMSKEASEKIVGNVLPTGFVTGRDASDFTGSYYETVQSREDLISSMDQIMKMMNAIIGIMILAAVVLGVVVVYNLGILSFQEKARDLATLRVLGFQYNRLVKILRKQNFWLAFTGILLGIPAGYILVSYLLRFMGDNLDMSPHIRFGTCLVSGAGIVVLSLVVGIFVNKKLKKINMVDALKSVE